MDPRSQRKNKLYKIEPRITSENISTLDFCPEPKEPYFSFLKGEQADFLRVNPRELYRIFGKVFFSTVFQLVILKIDGK